MTPNKPKKVIITDQETGSLIRTGQARGDDTRFYLKESLFGLSRDTIVRIVLGLIGFGFWYAQDINFKETIIKYIAKQDVLNEKVNNYMESSDNFHTSTTGVEFKGGRPLDTQAVSDRTKRINALIYKQNQ